MRRRSAPFTSKLAASALADSATIPHARAARPRTRRRGSRLVGSSKFALNLVLALWVMLLLNPHFFLENNGFPSPVLKLHIVVLGMLAIVMLVNGPSLKHLYAPLMVYTAFVVLYYPLGYNPAQALKWAKQITIVYGLAVATLALVQHPRHVKHVMLIVLLFQYLWYGAHGLMSGGPFWDPVYSNTDGFGSLMAMGFVSSLHVGMAATSPRLRWMAVGTSLLCVGGIVSSFARGAVLSAGLAFAFGWFRSGRRRLAYAGFSISMAIALVIAARVFTDVDRVEGEQSNFWLEMATIADDVADSDADDRRLIWKIARKEFMEHPLTGVGTGSFGAYAAENYSGSTVGERFAENPKRLYQRAVHNLFFQVLAEQGFIGLVLFLWLFIDFWRRNRAVRRSAGESDTTLLPGLRTRPLAVGLEVSMVAFLGASMFYNMLIATQFYLLLAANALLHVAWVRSRSISQPYSPPRRRPVGEFQGQQGRALPNRSKDHRWLPPFGA